MHKSEDDTWTPGRCNRVCLSGGRAQTGLRMGSWNDQGEPHDSFSAALKAVLHMKAHKVD